MVGNIAVGSSITSSGQYVLLGSVIGYGDLPLSAVISLVLLSLVNIGLQVDRLRIPFANRLLYITSLLLLFSVKVPTANSSQERFLRLFGLAL